MHAAESTDDESRMDGFCMRRARSADVPRIVELLANDPIGQRRERYADPLPATYFAAFQAIDRDPNQLLAVCCRNEAVIGVLQITFLPYLTYQGGWRALIEGVRTAPELRSQGIGRYMFEWAIEQARARGCHMVQLTTDKTRPHAVRFYTALGFSASHEGMKLHLVPASDGPSGGPAA
jgi:GNAT superfamily N-acetyltransferase